jgi:lipoprotein-releasing system permease protein
LKRKEDIGAVRHLWQSPWTSWVGLRYLKSKKNSKFLSFITLLSVFGVALGVTAMIVVLSVMDGFEAELKKRLMTSDLHVLVTPKPEAPGFDRGFVSKSAFSQEQIDEFVKAHPNVESFWPVVSTEAILRTGKKVTGVMVKGVGEARMKQLKTQLVESADPKLLIQRNGAENIRLPGVFVGQELA